MLSRLVELSVRMRWMSVVLALVILAGGVYAALRLPIDAIPDISPVQVGVLTPAPGMSAEEVERTVTFPLENALNGVPGMTELRSVSRGDISAITIVFEDGSSAWHVRQLVLERLFQIGPTLPEGVGPPELAPLSNGLGEIYQFVVRSDHHSARQLRTLLDWEIIPRMREVPGVIEINAMGGRLRQFQVIARPDSLRAHGLSIGDLADALRGAADAASGGYVQRGDESYTLRATGRFRDIDDIAEAVVRATQGAPPVLVRDVADVVVGHALPFGVVSHDGHDAVTGTVMMLVGSNSREVVEAVKLRMDEIAGVLPPGVEIVPVYDRANFVAATLRTVARNLAEGALVVGLVLMVVLGTVRGAVVVVAGIPVSMSIALGGMHLFGVTGDLMSLGAIDFGFLVDGPIVVLEAVLAVHGGRAIARSDRAAAYAETITTVVRPVFFSVAIIMLVYLPLLGLAGVEGKMFRPMAITMACALFGALVYATLLLPGLLVTLVPPPKREHPRWVELMNAGYRRALVPMIRRRGRVMAIAVLGLAAAGVLVMGRGADFVPRIDEGDLVVTIRRSPSIALDRAEALDHQVQHTLAQFPETLTSLAMTGRAEVATDPVGLDNTDVLVHLAPREEWTTASDLDGLSVRIKDAVESSVPGTFASVSQPIEDRTNELISGSRADVQIMLFGPDLEQLALAAGTIADIVRGIDGTGDVRVERTTGLPELTVRPNRSQMARHGVRMSDLMAAIEAARVGIPITHVFEGERRFELRLRVPPTSPTPEALERLAVETGNGGLVPLGELADVIADEGPPQIRRQDRSRTLRVDVNLRGRDLVSWVGEARRAVDDGLELPTGYDVAFGGQFENFQRASARLAVIVPGALVIVLVMLTAMFGDLRFALSVFTLVPLAAAGGVIGLVVRGLPFSIPAAVGLVALA
ncbi:MAG: efflux RND transporter permease subunit, partial [Deltaproteobacteria bacterium]|nr:efflux RND transporter permease subunit [Nannocystaceae bacterium]